jgi:tetratricopeptide (TPR) repeat protein
VTKRVKIAFSVVFTVFLLLDVALTVAAYYLISFYQGRRWFDQGCAAMARQDYDTAIARFDAALHKKLKSNYRAYAFHDLALCESARGRHDDAIRDYTEALRIDPSLSFCYSERGALYDNKGERDKAFSDYSEAIRLDPNDNRALFRRGLIDMQRKDWDKAIADFSETIRTWPSSATAYLNRGMAYSHKNDFDRALASVEAALQFRPRYAAAYVERGYIYTRKHELEKAMADFAEAIREDPKDGPAYRTRGFAFNHSKHWPEAITDFRKALELDSKDAAALEGRAYAYSQMHDQDHAIADFTEVMRIKKSPDAYTQRAAAYSGKGDYARALADLREAVKLAPNDSGALNNLAWLLATCPDRSTRDGNEAVVNATKACEMSHWKNAYVIDTLAAASAETGNFDAAIAYEDQALHVESVSTTRSAEMQKRLTLYSNRKAYHEERVMNTE